MTVFDINATKTSGQRNAYARTKINHALRTLWRQKDLEDAYITFQGKNQMKWWIFAKIGKKRAIASDLGDIEMPSSRPTVDDRLGWKRIPSKWNKIK